MEFCPHINDLKVQQNLEKLDLIIRVEWLDEGRSRVWAIGNVPEATD
jgi:hypothetical protein